jgi:hypothetical protein
MAKNFPPALSAAVRDPSVKLALLLEFVRYRPQDCENCSGVGYIHAFLATEGPFEKPGNPYRGDGKVSKWHNNHWWVGTTVSFVCPDCGGLGYVESPKMKL